MAKQKGLIERELDKQKDRQFGRKARYRRIDRTKHGETKGKMRGRVRTNILLVGQLKT